MAQSDEQRFERFYHAHYDRVAAYLLSRADRDVAHDALARTFEVAWRRFAEVPDEPLPWLLGVARHQLQELRRAEGRRDALIERIAETVPAATVDPTESFANRELLAKALADLSDAQREVLLLIAWDGLSQADAAAMLGCSRVAFAVRLHRARKRLRDALTEIAGNEQRVTRAPPSHPVIPPVDPSKASQLMKEAP